MKVSVVGTGYVGLVTGACLADVGNEVLCLDLDERKIGMLRGGEVPIHGPGLREIVLENARAGRLAFTTDPEEGALFGRVQMIAGSCGGCGDRESVSERRRRRRRRWRWRWDGPRWSSGIS